MANAYQAADYNNTPPQLQAFQPVQRPFFAVVNSGGATFGSQGIPAVTTLGSGDTIALATLPGQGTGIIITRWSMTIGVLDTGTHALVMSLGLVLDALDPGMTSAAATGFFATTITPGASGGTVDSYAGGLSSVIPVTLLGVPYSISDFVPNLNGGLYDLVLTVTTPAGTVSAVNAYIKGYIEYCQISLAWAN